MAEDMTSQEFAALRDSAGLTQEKVARYCGISSITVSRFERGAVSDPRSWINRAIGYMRSCAASPRP